MLDSIICYAEWEDKPTGGNENFMTVLADNNRECRFTPNVRLTEGDDGEWNGMCSFIARRGEYGNPDDAAEMLVRFQSKPLPYACAYCFDATYNLIIFACSKGDEFRGSCDAILKEYYKIAEKSKVALHIQTLEMNEAVDVIVGHHSRVISETAVFEPEGSVSTKLGERKNYTPDGIVSNNILHNPAGPAKDAYKNEVALSSADQLGAVTRNDKHDIYAEDGVISSLSHKRMMQRLIIRVKNPPNAQTEHNFPELNPNQSIRRTDTNIIWFIEKCLGLYGLQDIMEKTDYLVDAETGQRFSGTKNEINLISSLLSEYTGWSDTARVTRCIGAMIASNPVHRFYSSLPEYDHHDHIGDLCDTIITPKGWNPGRTIKMPDGSFMTVKQYKRMIIAPFLRCTVKRTTNHTFQTDHNDYPINIVPVLQGPQGCYKNTWIKRLCFVRGMYQEKGYIAPWSKDDTALFLSCMICHLDEIDSNTMRYYDLSNLKQLITKSTFEYRAPYDARPRICVNQCSFIGSTNREQFLIDESGSRRFFVIQVSSLDINTKVNIPQVWAQAKWEVEHGYPHYVPEVIEKASQTANSELTDFGIAPALISCLAPCTSQTDKKLADPRFMSVEAIFVAAYRASFGKAPQTICSKDKQQFRKLLQGLLGVDKNLSNCLVNVPDGHGGRARVYPFRMKGSIR